MVSELPVRLLLGHELAEIQEKTAPRRYSYRSRGLANTERIVVQSGGSNRQNATNSISSPARIGAPYQDPVGEDIVGVNEDEEPEYDDEFMNEEDLGRVETWGTRRNEDDDEEN